jgi:hypothetical protein
LDAADPGKQVAHMICCHYCNYNEHWVKEQRSRATTRPRRGYNYLDVTVFLTHLNERLGLGVYEVECFIVTIEVHSHYFVAGSYLLAGTLSNSKQSLNFLKFTACAI